MEPVYYRERIRDDRTRLPVAVPAGSSRTVGMGAGKVWLHADYLPPLSGELIDLWIDPEHRRRSLSRRIISQLLRFFRDNGVEFLVVSYVEGNRLGEGLWKLLGAGRPFDDPDDGPAQCVISRSRDSPRTSGTKRA